MEDWQGIPDETPINPSGLRPAIRRLVHSRAELSVFEAENIRAATVKYLAATPSGRLAPFTVAWVLRLHKDMLARVWLWAGQVRTSELNLGSPVWRIPTDIRNLLEDIRCWEAAGMGPDEQAARLHYRAVLIHPFENGNGRWARLLANIWLRQHGHPVTLWPEEGVTGGTSPIRAEYIQALKLADEGDMSYLIDLHRRYAQK